MQNILRKTPHNTRRYARRSEPKTYEGEVEIETDKKKVKEKRKRLKTELTLAEKEERKSKEKHMKEKLQNRTPKESDGEKKK